MHFLDYVVDVFCCVLKGNLNVRKWGNEKNYGIEYQRYTKDHL
jgi:hypothetical protein